MHKFRFESKEEEEEENISFVFFYFNTLVFNQTKSLTNSNRLNWFLYLFYSGRRKEKKRFVYLENKTRKSEAKELS